MERKSSNKRHMEQNRSKENTGWWSYRDSAVETHRELLWYHSDSFFTWHYYTLCVYSVYMFGWFGTVYIMLQCVPYCLRSYFYLSGAEPLLPVSFPHHPCIKLLLAHWQQRCSSQKPFTFNLHLTGCCLRRWHTHCVPSSLSHACGQLSSTYQRALALIWLRNTDARVHVLLCLWSSGGSRRPSSICPIT